MMEIKELTPFLSVSPQIDPSDLGTISAKGYKTIICNRPDGEADNQPQSDAIKQAAEAVGLAYIHMPIISGQITDQNVDEFQKMIPEMKGPVLAFCRTGTRSTSLWALGEAYHLHPDRILTTAARIGYDLEALSERLHQRYGDFEPSSTTPAQAVKLHKSFDVVVIGGGAGGISAASSILNRAPDLNVAIIEPSDRHYYQPGWTLVGGGVFDRAKTERPMKDVMPSNATWIRSAAAEFLPENNCVILEDGEHIGYRTLVASPGIKLNWDAIEGARESLGKNGVTSNYLLNMAPYTWELVQNLKGGTALFSQPPMPIKCAGAPQKAMYLSCDHWFHKKILSDINVSFHNAGGVLFGVADYVPSLMKYIEKYNIDLNFFDNLTKVDGENQIAYFDRVTEDKYGNKVTEKIEKKFDMLHICPPQTTPDFIRNSPLANEAGWIDVDPATLQHTKYSNIFALGDACSAPNAKTAAAIRKQAPTVAINVLAMLRDKNEHAAYDGYGSCPLTVERGKIVLAEFGYGGKLLPTFPAWFNDGRKPTRLAWILKEKFLPNIYFDLLLRGREWMVNPKTLPHRPPSMAAIPHDK